MAVAVWLKGRAAVQGQLVGGQIATQGQRAAPYRGHAGIDVRGGEGQGSAACLDQIARAGNDAAVCQRVGAIETQGRVVEDIARNAAACAAVADLQRSPADRGAAAVVICGVKGQGSRSGLGQGA